MDTLLQRILMPQRTLTARRTSQRMSSRHTVTVAESASDLETISMVVTADTMAATVGITAVMVDTTAVTVGTMVEIMADTTVAMADMADITVGTADIIRPC